MIDTLTYINKCKDSYEKRGRLLITYLWKVFHYFPNCTLVLKLSPTILFTIHFFKFTLFYLIHFILPEEQRSKVDREVGERRLQTRLNGTNEDQDLKTVVDG